MTTREKKPILSFTTGCFFFLEPSGIYDIYDIYARITDEHSSQIHCFWNFDLIWYLRRSCVSKRKCLFVSFFKWTCLAFTAVLQLHLEQISIKMTSSKPEYGNEYLLHPRDALEEVPGRYLFLYLVAMATSRLLRHKPPCILNSCWDLAVYLAFGCRILWQKVGFLRGTHVIRYPCKSDLLVLVLEFWIQRENSINVKVVIGIVSIA